jgi:hypothetical protein
MNSPFFSSSPKGRNEDFFDYPFREWAKIEEILENIFRLNRFLNKKKDASASFLKVCDLIFYFLLSSSNLVSA